MSRRRRSTDDAFEKGISQDPGNIGVQFINDYIGKFVLNLLIFISSCLC